MDSSYLRYRDDYFFRKDVMWKATSQLYNRYIKDTVKYQKNQEKKFGPIYAEIFSIAYQEQSGDKCIAVLEDCIDKVICNRYGWETIQSQRQRELEKLRADLKG